MTLRRPHLECCVYPTLSQYKGDAGIERLEVQRRVTKMVKMVKNIMYETRE